MVRSGNPETNFRSEEKPLHKLNGRTRLPLWGSPAIFLCLFMLLFVGIFWLVEQRIYNSTRNELETSADTLTKALRLRLEGNQDYIRMLARERSDGLMAADLFQQRASRYVQDHPELINITWVEADFHINTVAPLAGNQQIIGLRLELPEPKRVSQLAMERRQPVYTRPFEAIQGKPSFEVWVPVYRGNVFLGLFGGVYSCEKLLQHLIPPQLQKSCRASLVDSAGRILWKLPETGTTEKSLVLQTLLTPEESGVQLRLDGYGQGIGGMSRLLLEFLCLVLVAGISYSMWGLRREVEIRRQAEAELRKSEQSKTILHRIANIFLTVPDEETYGEVLSVVLEVMESRYGVFGFIADNGDLTIPTLTRDVWSQCQVQDKSIHFPSDTWGESLWGRAIREKRIFLSSGPFQIPDGHIGIDNFLSVPIVFGGKSIGLISVANSPNGYTEENKNLLESIAGCISPVLNAQRQRDRQKQERERAEQHLGLLSFALNRVHEEAYLSDENACLRYVNEEACRVLGYDSDELLGMKVTDVDPDFKLGGWLKHWHDLKSRGSMTIESRHKTSKGLVYPVEITATYFEYDGQGYILGLAHDISERKRAEELRLRLVSIVESSDDAIFSKTGDGIITSWNNGAEKMFGYSSSEVVGKHVSILFPPESNEEIMFLLESIRAGRSISHYETKRIRKNREAIFVSLSISPLRDNSGRIVGASTIARDITERRQVEEDLRRANAYNRTLIEASLDPLVTIDAAGKITDVNTTTEKITGYTRQELIGKDFSDYFTEPAKAQAGYQRVFREGAVHDYPLEIRHRDGQITSVLYNASIYRNESGEVIGVFAAARDITELKRAEEELQRVKNYLANVIDSMPAILVGIDRNGSIIQWNREAEQHTGIPAQDAIGKHIGMLLSDFSPWITSLQADSGRPAPASLEKLPIMENGERHYYDLMLYPLVANCIEGAVVRIEDVTERVRIMELMVQTEKMLSVGGLAAGMAHEINNPLGIINQAVHNIERRLTTDLPGNRDAAKSLGLDFELLHAYFARRNIKQFISIIHEATSRAAKIVSNMLEFSRQSSKNMQSVSLAELVNRAVELAANDYDLKKKYDFRSIEIVREYDPDLPPVPVAAVEIEQVILNLLKNAAYAVMTGSQIRSPRITLRLRREAYYATLEVEDNGPGMEENVSRRVFEPFFTTKEPGEGTGLGLSVSYMIITNNHKGFMTVNSIPGAGACFTVRLPLSKEEIHE